MASLGEQYRQGGLARLLQTVRERSARESGRSIYHFSNQIGRRLAGNLDGLPTDAIGKSGWIDFPYEVDTADHTRNHRARAYFTRLTGGFTLLVGRDVEEMRQFAQLIRGSLYIALAMALVIGLGGGLLMSRNFLRRIDTISATSRSIMGGGMSERMPVSGTDDELDRLSKNLNEMLDQIERLMSGMKEVSANVAHDLKTPLTRLRARVEAALREGSKPAFKAALNETIEEADEMLRIFNALLSIARAEAGNARELFEIVDVSQILEELAELYSPLVEDAKGDLETSIAPDLIVNGDRQLLAQAISNLIDNAIKYAVNDGAIGLKVAILAASKNDEIMITVADNGPGISEQDRERVIDRFVRLDASRSQPGSGLGLSLVAGVATLHGGKLELSGEKSGLKASLILPEHHETR